MRLGGQIVDQVGKGRYLDRWQRDTAGRWRIAARSYLSDLASTVPVASNDIRAVLAPQADGLTPLVCRRDGTNPSYALFAP